MSGFRPPSGGKDKKVTIVPVDEGIGFIDIGEKRIQFGQVTTTGKLKKSFDLNLDFDDDEYNIIATAETEGRGFSASIFANSKSSFNIDPHNSVKSKTITWNWQAIGKKPKGVL